MTDAPDLLFIKDFFDKLQQQCIKYCILRNADEVEHGDAHDVDMTVDASMLPQTEAALSDTAKQHGWQLHLKTGKASDRQNIKCYHYSRIDEEQQQIRIVHIDIFPTFNWKGIELLPNQALVSDIQPSGLFPKAASHIEAVCNLFTRLLFNGYVKDKYKEGIQNTFLATPDKTKQTLRYFLSEEQTVQVYNLASSGQWSSIEQNRSLIVSCIKKTARHHKWNYFTYVMGKALLRKGIVIAFQGTDGSGKSTIIEGIPAVIGNSFSGDIIEYYHWRPGFLHPEKKYTADGQLLSNVQPHTKKPQGKMKSFAKMAFYTLDYILGYFGQVYWQAAKGHLVVFDRYYYDFYMDKIRYRLSIGDGVVHFFSRFIPKPDVTFLLIGDAQQIYNRKPELPVEEIQKQIDTLTRYKDKISNPVIIDVNHSIPHVRFNVCSHILEILTKRAGKSN